MLLRGIDWPREQSRAEQSSGWRCWHWLSEMPASSTALHSGAIAQHRVNRTNNKQSTQFSRSDGKAGRAAKQLGSHCKGRFLSLQRRCGRNAGSKGVGRKSRQCFFDDFAGNKVEQVLNTWQLRCLLPFKWLAIDAEFDLDIVQCVNYFLTDLDWQNFYTYST